jgi:formylglycine-generating enzyme required for sulfatase activity/serine/threonine protein kinase
MQESGPEGVPRATATDASGVLPPGFRLADRYRIVKHIAAGGFGITYLAEHEGLKKQYAIKEHFPREFSSRQGSSVVPNTADRNIFGWALKRFAEEAEKLARFKHPAIVNVADVFEANGTAYMVMEFEPGQNMSKWLDGLARPPSQTELDRIAGPLLDALEVMHGASFLHRDIAPDNIMVRPDGSPCLIDFGAARQAMGQQTKTLTAIVKAGYSPVEQYDTDGTGEGQGPWTDIYALAATLYRATTGTKPPEAPGRTVVDRCAPAAQKAAPGYRPSFLQAIDAGLRVAPAARPQSIAAWRGMLLGADAASLRSPATHVTAAPLSPSTMPRAAHLERAPPARPERAPVASGRPAASSQAGSSAPQWPPPGPGYQPPEPRRRSGALVGMIVLSLGALSAAGWFLGKPMLERTMEARRQQEASTEAERQRQSRHAAAASEWSRVKDTTDEAVIERFIAAHGDAPAAAEAKTRLAMLKGQRQARERNEQAAREWDRIKGSEDETVLERFIAAYGDTPSAVEARTRLASLRREKAARTEAERQKQVRIALAANEWSRIKDTTDEALIERFITAHPDTPAAQEAKTRLASLKEEAAARRRLQGPHVLSAAEERALRPKDEFQECDACPRMVVVPAGRFNMGSPPDEKDRDADEGPVHEVSIARPFAVGKFELTFAEWEACAADGGCTSNRSPSDQGWGRDKRPVINVSWDDAKEYVAWLKRKTGKDYRLLTEAEWEYAARAGTRTRYSWGNDASHEFANYGSDTCCSGLAQGRDQWVNTAPVGQFAANAFGLHDLHGNVWEWVEDCYIDNYYGGPNDGSARTTGNCSRRVLRGGSWVINPQYLRSAYRDRGTSDNRLNNFGFRLARTLSP